MIIEFTGVPCSGKSAISHELATLLKKEGYTVCEKQYLLSHAKSPFKRISYKLLMALKYALFHPKNTFYFYKNMPSKSLLLNLLFLNGHHCKGDFCILEQGYLQLLGSVFEGKEFNDNNLSSFAEIILPKQNHLQVIVTISNETVLKRANDRSDKPYFIFSQDPMSSIKQASVLVKELQSVWNKNFGASMTIEVSNEEENGYKLVAADILKTIKRMELI